MIETLGISETKNVLSPLEELSKSFDVLPNKELNKSLDCNPCSVDGITRTQDVKYCPQSGGMWTGERGNATWCPNNDLVPNKYNPENRTWEEIKDMYNIDGIPFLEGEPNFSEISKGTVEIKDFSDERYGIGGNFDQADEKLAELKGCTKQEVIEWRKSNNYTWHERSDCRTMDKVPREIHGNIAHCGGISIIKNNYNDGR